MDAMNNNGANDMTENRTMDLGNNESLSEGVFQRTDADGDTMFLAMTFTQSKWFKTLKGAQRWYARKTQR